MKQNSAMNSNKFLDEKEVHAFLNSVESDAGRNGLMLSLLWLTGARCCEMLSLRLCDLNPVEKSVRITAAKGSLDRELPLPEAFFDKLYQYALSRHIDPMQMIFDIKYNQLGEIWRGHRPMGCEKGLHSLRHTFAVGLYKKTKDLHLVKTALGHKSIQSTMIYQDFVYTQGELRKALIV